MRRADVGEETFGDDRAARSVRRVDRRIALAAYLPQHDPTAAGDQREAREIRVSRLDVDEVPTGPEHLRRAS